MAFKVVKKLFLILALSLPVSWNCAGEEPQPLSPLAKYTLGGLVLYTILVTPLFVAGKVYKNPQSAHKYLTSPYLTDTIGGKPFPYVHPIVPIFGLFICKLFFYSKP